MDIKTVIIQRAIDITGNIIADQLSKPDWESRKENISNYYKDLQPIRDTLPDTPDTEEPREYREKEKAKVDKIVAEICTPDLAPRELLECRECVESVMRGSNTDIIQKYFEPSL